MIVLEAKKKHRVKSLIDDIMGKRGRIVILDFGQKPIYNTVKFTATLKYLESNFGTLVKY